MLIWFVVAYLALSIGIGLYVATRVHNTKDFAVAGRCLPMPVVMATVFLVGGARSPAATPKHKPRIIGSTAPRPAISVTTLRQKAAST